MHNPAGFVQEKSRVWERNITFLLVISLVFSYTLVFVSLGFFSSVNSTSLIQPAGLISHTNHLIPIEVVGVQESNDSIFEVRLAKEGTDNTFDLQVVDLDYSKITLTVVDSVALGRIFISPYFRLGFSSLVKNRGTHWQEASATSRNQGVAELYETDDGERLFIQKNNNPYLSVLTNKPQVKVLLC